MHAVHRRSPLVPYETSLTTFGPEQIRQTDEQFTAGGMAILGDLAYVAQNSGGVATVRVFNIADPVSPQEITGPPTDSFALRVPPPVTVIGHPADIAAEDASPVTGGPVVAVATTNLTFPYRPSNIRLYDVSDERQWKWIGAVTLGKGPVDGMIQRIVLRGELLYSVTAGVGKGVQVVDLSRAKEIFENKPIKGEQDQTFWDMMLDLSIPYCLEPSGHARTSEVAERSRLNAENGAHVPGSKGRGEALDRHPDERVDTDLVVERLQVRDARRMFSDGGTLLAQGPIPVANLPAVNNTRGYF